jgi:hypothetical protein
LVDEYQDTNRLQSPILFGLKATGHGHTVVRDDTPSIYSLHEVHYAMVAVLAIGISVFEPPFGEATLPSAESAPRKNETDCQLNDRALLGTLGRCGIVDINRILEEALRTTELPTPPGSTIRPRSCQKGQHHSDSDGGRFRSSWRRSCRAPHLDGLCEGTVDNKIGARNAARNRARKKNDARGNFLRSAHAARRI